MKYTELLAKMRLERNEITVDKIEGFIVIQKHKHVGIKLWGAIDYLQNKHKYIVIREV